MREFSEGTKLTLPKGEWIGLKLSPIADLDRALFHESDGLEIVAESPDVFMIELM